jgi:hypothetical protein
MIDVLLMKIFQKKDRSMGEKEGAQVHTLGVNVIVIE